MVERPGAVKVNLIEKSKNICDNTFLRKIKLTIKRYHRKNSLDFSMRLVLEI